MSEIIKYASIVIKAAFESIKSYIWFLVGIFVLKTYSGQYIQISWIHSVFIIVALGVFEYHKAKKETERTLSN